MQWVLSKWEFHTVFYFEMEIPMFYFEMEIPMFYFEMEIPMFY